MPFVIKKREDYVKVCKDDSYRSKKPWLPDISNDIGTWRDDWRLMGQEGYLMDKVLVHRIFDRSLCVLDFDQCDFCHKVFDKNPDHPLPAYFQPDQKLWICEECYEDFKDHFHWIVEDNL